MAADLHLTIVHLYGDVMNTYGDWGNIAALLYRGRQRSIAMQVEPVSVGDTLAHGQADILFFGGGQDAGQEVVAADLPRLHGVLAEDIEQGVPMLAICGGYQLLGQRYVAGNGKVMAGLSILPVETTAGGSRMMHNVVVAINPQMDIPRGNASTLVGFENHSGHTKLLLGAVPLGRVLKGSGNNGLDGTEGVLYKNAIGTYLHGSCLPKNPHLADWILQKALERKYGPMKLSDLDDQLEWQAHRLAVELKA